MLIPTMTAVQSAARHHHGIGAFNVIHLETAEAIVEAAEESGLPVILQISENCIGYHRALEPISRALIVLAEQSSAHIALHLDHAEDINLAYRAIDLGFGSVMFDASREEYSANVALTKKITEHAHDAGVAVEAELGEVGGKDGAHAFGARTDPTEAATFVSETKVDMLAVAVGSSHAMAERTAQLDCSLIAELKAAVPVPLVLHGSSGVPDLQLAASISAGITKVNVSTQLNRYFTAAVRQYLVENPTQVDSRKYVALGRTAVRQEAARLLRLFATGTSFGKDSA